MTTQILDLRTQTNIKRRFLAALIDYSIINLICFLLIMVLGTPDENEVYHLEGWPMLFLVLVWILFTVVLESVFGSTLGNAIVKLKPISINNPDSKISFSQSFIRHIVDPIDMFPFGIIGILIIKNSPLNQRLGDILAKTIVVRNV